MLLLPKQHVFLEILVEKKAFYFSKKPLCAGTAPNKSLKKAPAVTLLRLKKNDGA